MIYKKMALFCLRKLPFFGIFVKHGCGNLKKFPPAPVRLPRTCPDTLFEGKDGSEEVGGRRPRRYLLGNSYWNSHHTNSQKEEEMKRAFAVMMMVLFLAGCGAAARESGFYEHSSMYKDLDHLAFSMWGYKTLEQKEVQMSKDQDWWGKTIWGSN